LKILAPFLILEPANCPKFVYECQVRIKRNIEFHQIVMITIKKHAILFGWGERVERSKTKV